MTPLWGVDLTRVRNVLGARGPSQIANSYAALYFRGRWFLGGVR